MMRSVYRLAFSVVVLSGCSAPAPTPVSIHHISQSGQGAYEVSLAVSDAGLAAAWHDTRDGNPEIYARRLDPDGRPTGPEWRLTDDLQLSYEADVALLDDSLVVAWYDRSSDGRLESRVGRWAREGTRTWVRSLPVSSPEHATRDTQARNPLVLVRGTTMFCAWIEPAADETSAVYGQWLDEDGQAVTPPARLAPAGDTTWNLNGVLDEAGRPWLVFDAAVETESEERFLVRVLPSGPLVLQLTADDGFPSKYPDLALSDGRVALTWFDERDGNREIYLFGGSLDGLAHASVSARRVTQTPGESIGAYVNWNGGRIGLAWSDDHDGQHEVYFQPFDPGGAPLEPARRLTDNTTASLIPAIVPLAEGFGLAWNEDIVAERGDHESGGRSEIVFARVE
jgi:hypothetical protein